MNFAHLCSVFRKMEGENPIGEDSDELEPVTSLQAVPCVYSTEKVWSKKDESAESYQTEMSILLFSTDTDIRKDDVIKSIRLKTGTVLKHLNYKVETFSEKPSIIRGLHHRTATLKELS